MPQLASLRVRSIRGAADVACAAKPLKRPFKKKARKASFLKLSEELQTRYGLPQFPSCRPEDADFECGDGRVEIDSLIRLLPPTMQQVLLQHEHKAELLEVVMDLGRTPLARFPYGDVEISNEPIGHTDLELAVAQVADFGSDNRAGINATLHRISCMRNRTGRIVGLTARVGRSVPGSAAMITDLAMDGASILLLGRPGVGKTTAIREVSRLLAGAVGKRVVICDTSNEIGGDGDVPHPGIGRARRMQVVTAERQHEVMIEAVENHMPQVVVIDEIGTEEETAAARTISQRGVQLVATAHGNELGNVIKNPSLVDLVGGIGSVTLGDDEAKRRGGQKSVLERQGLPTFDVCIEMLSRTEWAVWEDVGVVVDMLLLGKDPPQQIRTQCEDGRVIISDRRLSRAELQSARTELDAAHAREEDAGPSMGPAEEPFGESPSSSSSSESADDWGSLDLAGEEVTVSLDGLEPEVPNAEELERRKVARGPPGWGAAGPNAAAPRDAAGAPESSSDQEVEDAPAGPMVGPQAAGPASAAQRKQSDIDSLAGLQGGDATPHVGSVRSHALSSSDEPIENLDELPPEDGDGGSIRAFLYGVQDALVRQAATAVAAPTRVRVVSHIKDADLVLSTRQKMRSGTGKTVRDDAREAGVPIMSMKGASLQQCVSALRLVLGVDPIAGVSLGSAMKPGPADRLGPKS